MSNDAPGPQWDQPRYNDPSYNNPSAQGGPQQSWSPQHHQRPATPGPWNPNQGGSPSQEERTWAMLAHLSAPIAWIVSAGWLNIAGPLIIWFFYKDRSWFVRNAAAGSFNFTLSMWLISLVGWFLTLTIILAPIGIPLLIIGGLGALILGCLGAFRTYQGQSYTYPWQLKILN